MRPKAFGHPSPRVFLHPVVVRPLRHRLFRNRGPRESTRYRRGRTRGGVRENRPMDGCAERRSAGRLSRSGGGRSGYRAIDTTAYYKNEAVQVPLSQRPASHGKNCTARRRYGTPIWGSNRRCGLWTPVSRAWASTTWSCMRSIGLCRRVACMSRHGGHWRRSKAMGRRVRSGSRTFLRTFSSSCSRRQTRFRR